MRSEEGLCKLVFTGMRRLDDVGAARGEHAAADGVNPACCQLDMPLDLADLIQDEPPLVGFGGQDLDAAGCISDGMHDHL